jgi:hypothetical protein
MRSSIRIAALGALLAAAGCTHATDRRQTALSPEAVESPASGNSTSPQITTSSRGLLLSWLERSGSTSTLKFSERSASGWSAPVTVASGALVANYADVPSVLRLSDGALVAHWTKETDRDREGTDLLLSRSTDDGRSWSAPVSPHHDGTLTQHAFATLFELPGNGAGVVWLDARAYDQDKDEIGLRYAAFDAGWKQTADAPVDNRVCECCPTTAALTADGVLTAYRDRSDEEVRDIFTARLENGTWTAGQPVHRDGWTIDACPVNGPALSSRGGRDAAIAWFTAKDGAGQAYAAFSSDAGRSWGSPIRLDDAGSLGRVAIELLDDGTAVASWVELADKRGQLKVRRLDRSGAKSPAAAVADVPASATSSFPRMKLLKDDLVFAWTERSASSGDDEAGSRVKTAVAHVPR